MEKYERKAIFSRLDKYCTFAKDEDFIEVTRWHNGEGYDIDLVNQNLTRRFQFTHGELRALKKMIKKLEK
jgi:hypothetical protein